MPKNKVRKKYVLQSLNLKTIIVSKGRKIYQDQTLEIIGQLVVNSKDMAQSMRVANEEMADFDRLMERLIDKL